MTCICNPELTSGGYHRVECPEGRGRVRVMEPHLDLAVQVADNYESMSESLSELASDFEIVGRHVEATKTRRKAYICYRAARAELVDPEPEVPA